MKSNSFDNDTIAYIEIYAPMAKPLVYWHVKALGFSVAAYAGPETGKHGFSSYVLTSGRIRLVLTSEFHVRDCGASEVSTFVGANHCGVKRIAFHSDSVKEKFKSSIANGAIPLKFPVVVEDEHGYVEEASIKLYDNSEIVFIDTSNYKGIFRPGYKSQGTGSNGVHSYFQSVDHIASELRINEIDYWTDYLKGVIGSQLVQKIGRTSDNRTGMLLNISQTSDKNVTFVMTEPESHQASSKVNQSLEKFGPGIHHIAFSTDDIVGTIRQLRSLNVEFVSFPAAYYNMLKSNNDFEGMDIDALEEQGILIDKEGDSFLLQKFVKPMGDRPYFFYEIVQRVNGYDGFALKNIEALRKAEEIQITQVSHA